MSRQFLRLSQILIDCAMLGLAIVMAFLVRFDGVPPASMMGRLFLTGPYVVLWEYCVLLFFGVHRFSWRYVGLREATRIGWSVGLASCGLILARLIVGEMHDDRGLGYLRHGVIPLGVLGANAVFCYVGIAGVRMARRMLGEKIESSRRRLRGQRHVRTLLIGAGEAGVLVARELASRPDLALKPVGFLDDDRGKIGTVIHGIPVVGATTELPERCRKHRAEQVLITMANVPGSAIRRIRALSEEAGIPAKIVPGVYEIVGGQVNLSRIRDVAIEDLLRREPVQLDVDSVAAHARGRVVLVSGAGGSIGSELCRQVCRFGPAHLVLVERMENALFNIHRELVASHPNVRVVPCIADVTDEGRMREVFDTHRPALVLHAAAHKHVPMMEWNPGEAVKNNVVGTKIIADLAKEYEVDSFVMISTDKAVNPTSIMGASKRAAEMYVQARSQGSSTRFVTVRFGNVLGSAGSVIPIFQEQIAAGGPVTVTHPEMRRYFMTIPEACQLVLQAGAMGRGGEIFILDMGEPVRIVDLARDLIALSGLREGEDIEVAFSGVRPGEKLFEELSTTDENADKTRHPKIFVGRIPSHTLDSVSAQIERLKASTQWGHAAVVQALRAMVPEYAPEAAVSERPLAQEQTTAVELCRIPAQ